MMQTELELLKNPNVKVISVGRHTIYQGDCCEGLKMIKDNSVHLIVTSPPYNIGIDYGSYKDTLSFEQYTAFAEAWLRECFRILVNGGRVCVNVPFTTIFGPDSPYNLYYNIMRKLGFKSGELIVWVKKRKCDGQFLRRKPYYGKASSFNPCIQYCSEAILVMYKNSFQLDGLNSDLTEQEFLKWNYNVWEIDTEPNREHPAPFSEELPMRLIKIFSYPEQIVLDPFLGSGTTMKVADELNRVCIGCELDESYVEMTLARMKISPKSLVASTPTPQPALLL